eukprot:1161079-Pelagomonas_calceolata.AAC.9
MQAEGVLSKSQLFIVHASWWSAYCAMNFAVLLPPRQEVQDRISGWLDHLIKLAIHWVCGSVQNVTRSRFYIELVCEQGQSPKGPLGALTTGTAQLPQSPSRLKSSRMAESLAQQRHFDQASQNDNARIQFLPSLADLWAKCSWVSCHGGDNEHIVAWYSDLTQSSSRGHDPRGPNPSMSNSGVCNAGNPNPCAGCKKTALIIHTVQVEGVRCPALPTPVPCIVGHTQFVAHYPYGLSFVHETPKRSAAYFNMRQKRPRGRVQPH